MKKPFRIWMTGGVAMILAAFGSRAIADDDERLSLTGLSRYSITETVSRIEAVAQQRGLRVLVRMPQSQPHGHGARQVIVLESTQGGTPVAMASAHARPDLLLSVVVQQGRNGATEVLLPEGAMEAVTDGVSAEVQTDLSHLPGVVAQALA